MCPFWAINRLSLVDIGIRNFLNFAGTASIERVCGGAVHVKNTTKKSYSISVKINYSTINQK